MLRQWVYFFSSFSHFFILSIPSRMLHSVFNNLLELESFYFQFLLGCFIIVLLDYQEKQISLSIPSRMLLPYWSTFFPLIFSTFQFLLGCFIVTTALPSDQSNLSIPSRMLHTLPFLLSKKLSNFQFLLGCFNFI